MKRSLIVLVVCGLLLASCASPSPSPAPATSESPPSEEEASSQSSPARVPKPRPTARIPSDAIYYTKRSWPACHYDPEYIHDSTNIMTDEFDGELLLDWSWVNEDSTHWTLDEVPGALRIVSQAGSLADGLEGVQNILTHPVPPVYFDIIANVIFEPSDDYQEAAILVELEDGSVVSMGRRFCAEENEGCLGGEVHFEGPQPDCVTGSLPADEAATQLIIRGFGRSLVGYWMDGDELTEVGRCFTELASMSLGLAAFNGEGSAGEVPADFDVVVLYERY